MNKRIALVTGVIGGIGKAIACRLASEGMKVVVSDFPGKALNETAKTLNLAMISADLSDPDSVKNLKTQLFESFGPTSVVVNAAGGVCNQIGIKIENVKSTQWNAIFKANVDSAFYLSRAFVPEMKESGWGRIITISSGAGLRPSLTGIQAYTAAKHALVGLTKQLSFELGRFGITVNSIAPGFILSNPATKKQWKSYGKKGQIELINKIHTRRLGKPEDIAAATAFLASEEASWITGQVLGVDGGIN